MSDAQLAHRRPQFSLRTLLVGVAGVAGLLALVNALSPLAAVLAIWFLVLVGAHVAGNSLGVRVGRRDLPDDGERPSESVPPTFAPDSRLRHPHPTILGRTTAITSGISAATGCVLGTYYLLRFAEGLNARGLIVGAVSSAILGGLFGYLASSFLTVAGFAIGEASRIDHGANGRKDSR